MEHTGGEGGGADQCDGTEGEQKDREERKGDHIVTRCGWQVVQKSQEYEKWTGEVRKKTKAFAEKS